MRDPLQAVLGIQDIFLAHPDWRKRHECDATDQLTPLQYTADCSLQSVDLKKIWERGTMRATTILEQHPQIGSPPLNVLESLFQSGATLLKPCGAPLMLDKEDEFLGTAPDTKVMEDSDPTDACSLKSWLRCHGCDRNRAYVPCANGHTVHIPQLVNEYFNGNVEHASSDRLRRTAQTARFGQTPMNVNNVSLSDNCNFDEADGRWVIPLGTLCAFVKIAKVPNCLSCVHSHTLVWHIPACGPRKQQNFVLFCGAAIALARMCNHVAMHLQKGEGVTDPRTHGAAEPCALCGRTTGTCTTSIVVKKISSTCPCEVPLKHAVAMRKQENMPCECPIPAWSAPVGFEHQNSLGTLPSHRGTKHR